MTTSPSVRLSELSNSLSDLYRVSGIGKLISEGTVLACYPLHDGTKHTIVSVGLPISWLSHTRSYLIVFRELQALLDL